MNHIGLGVPEKSPQHPESVLLGGGTRGQFAKQPEQGSCRFLIGEIFQGHSSREVWRLGVESDTDKIFVTPGSQCIHHRTQLDRPVFFGGENHRTGPGDGPRSRAL